LELAEALRQLGPDWDERRLAGFDASVQARGLVDAWKRRLDEAEREAAEAEHEARALAQSVADSELSAGEREAQFARMPKPALELAALEQRQATVQAARGRLDEWLRARDRRVSEQDTAASLAAETVPALGAKGRSWSAMQVTLLVVGGLFGLVGVGAGGLATVAGALIGAVLAVGALWLHSRTAAGATVAPSRSPAAVAAERRANLAAAAEADARIRLDEGRGRLGGARRARSSSIASKPGFAGRENLCGTGSRSNERSTRRV